MTGACLLSLCLAATCLYVSPTGDDANPGTRERPVATPEGARAAVRRLKASRGLPPGGVRVEFAKGVWPRTTAISLDARDSGTSESPITWRAAVRGGTVFTAGIRPVWRPLAADEAPLLPAEARRHVRVATIPGTGVLPGFTAGGNVLAHAERFEIPISLYEGESRLVCARWPDDRIEELPHRKKPILKADWKEGRVPFVSPRLAAWANEPELWVLGLWRDWYAEVFSRVRSVRPEEGCFCIEQPFESRGLGKTPAFFVFNAFCELDRPGEWVVDRAARRVYVWPKTEDGAPDVAIGGGLLCATNAAHLVFEGLVFEQAREDAVFLKDCTNVTLAASCVRHTGAWAVRVEGGRDCRVEGCDLYDLGQGGASLLGGDPTALMPAGHVAENCHVHDYGKIVWNYRPGVFLSGTGCTATHNLIYNSWAQGIAFRGGEHRISWNVVHDTCAFNEDAGAIYCYMENWTGRGSVVEHNCVHKCGRSQENMAMAIYLDAYSSDITVRGNIVSDSPIGIFSSGGQGNTIERNVVMNSRDPLRRWNLGLTGSKRVPYADAGDGYKSLRFRGLKEKLDSPYGSLWCRRYPTIAKILAVAEKEGPQYAHDALFVTFRDNALVPGGKPRIIDSDLTRDYQTVTNNVEIGTQPGFVDYGGMDWELRPDSPVRKILGGGTEFSRMGLYESPWRFSPPVKFGAGVTPPRELLIRP